MNKIEKVLVMEVSAIAYCTEILLMIYGSRQLKRLKTGVPLKLEDGKPVNQCLLVQNDQAEIQTDQNQPTTISSGKCRNKCLFGGLRQKDTLFVCKIYR